MEQLLRDLVQANLELTRIVIDMHRPVQREVVPSFDEFAQEMTPEEKLFYTEDEEDEAFAQAAGLADKPDPSFMKEVLKEAGLAPTVTTA